MQERRGAARPLSSPMFVRHFACANGTGGRFPSRERSATKNAMSSLAKLALADGTVYTGTAFGADGEIFGEVVFNTSMTGYQEILTDPSYCGQIVTMTYPLIGNYGINEEDIESSGLSLSGFIVRELCREPSNYRSTKSLDQYLREAGIVGLEGIDTRALVRRIRVHGAMTGVLSTVDLDDASLVRKAQASPDLVGRDLVQEVMPEARSHWQQGLSALGMGFRPIGPGTFVPQTPGRAPHVVAIDYGMKWNIPRHLTALGCRVTVVPGNSSADEVLALEPDGVFLSNGPGDPRPLVYAVDTIRNLLGQETDLRHLPGPSAPRPGVRRQDLQAEIRPPRCQPTGARSPQQSSRNHQPEPRFRARGRLVHEQRRSDAR